MRRWTAYRWPLLLTALLALLVVRIWPDGLLFGSETDWYCQHITLAETIRTECLAQKTAAPAFLPLGGGSNGYQFAYYGYFRPDILLGCLMPRVPMTVLVPAYLLAGYLAAALLCYALLRAHRMEPGWAFWGSVLFFSAACFFHLHRQIMFVNYLPFLLAALLSVRKGKAGLLPLWIFLICIHSFYYAPACLAVVGWYWYSQAGHLRFWRQYAVTAALGVGLAAMLLLPAGLAVLEHRRSGSGAGLTEILAPNLSGKSLLYDAYGVGLTAVCLYALLLGLTRRRFFRDSAVYLAACAWKLIPYLLNGTLYTRSKILIPLLPLLVLHTVRVLRASDGQRAAWWPALALPAVLLPYLGNARLPWLAADVAVVMAVALAGRRLSRRVRYGLLLALPVLLAVQNAQSENFAKPRAADAFSAAEYQQVCRSRAYRFESLTTPLDQANRLLFAGQQKMTMYSSVTNQAYNALYFDLLQTPIRVNNRTAMPAQANPFLLRLLGVRYIQADADRLPAGYMVLRQSGRTVLAENPAVLPIAYTTADTIGRAQFDQLADMDKLTALTTHTVVEQADEQVLDAAVTEIAPGFSVDALPDGVTVTQDRGSCRLDVDKQATLTLTRSRALRDSVLLIDFEVQNHTAKAVEITINGVRNRLSNAAAPYPNGNDHFRYQLSSPDGIGRLEVTLSAGSYTIGPVRWQTCPLSLLTEQQIQAVQLGPAARNEILSGSAWLEEDGYLVTSIPLQNGMELYVDGQPAALERVNLAFAGARLPAGTHTVSLRFTPPGQTAGRAISLVCLFGWMVYQRRKKHAAQT